MVAQPEVQVEQLASAKATHPETCLSLKMSERALKDPERSLKVTQAMRPDQDPPRTLFAAFSHMKQRFFCDLNF